MNQFDFAIGNGGPFIGSPPYSFMLKFVMHWLCFLVQRHPTGFSLTRRSPVFAPAAPRVTRTLLANPRRSLVLLGRSSPIRAAYFSASPIPSLKVGWG